MLTFYLCQLITLKRRAINEGIAFSFRADRRYRAVSGIDFGGIRQRHQFIADAVHFLIVIGTGEIRPPDAVIEQSIAGKNNPVSQQTDAALSVSRCV